MEEARAVHAAVMPSESLFVLDAMVGQDAVRSAGAFHEALPLTGVVLTKADGDARGGAALSVRQVTGLPIKLIGTGERLDGLEPFSPSGFASRILGMGDVVGLVERVERGVDRAAMEQVTAKVKKGRSLNFNDFKQQLEQIGKMGGLETLLEHLPGGAGIQAGALSQAGFDGRAIRRQIAMIDSMTRKERLNPALIDGSRKRRIAAGSGVGIQDVSRLIKQHRQLVKTMKRVSKGGGLERLMASARRGPKGFGRRR
jgi:signal recognition particle subunit SRP54